MMLGSAKCLGAPSVHNDWLINEEFCGKYASAVFIWCHLLKPRAFWDAALDQLR